MAFSYGTMISTPSGDVPIERVERGVEVLTASLGGGAPVWTPSAVVYSDGIGPGGRTTGVLIDFGDPDDFDDSGRLLCEMGQLFLSAEGRLVPAHRLYRGRSLRRPDGGQRLIRAVSVGQSDSGIRGIATGLDYRGTPDGHLIAVGGVIAGDFLLQMHHLEDPDEAGPQSPAPGDSE